jgi:hypothetical protein
MWGGGRGRGALDDRPGGILGPALQLHELVPDLLALGHLLEEVAVQGVVLLHPPGLGLVGLQQLLSEAGRVQRRERVPARNAYFTLCIFGSII